MFKTLKLTVPTHKLFITGCTHVFHSKPFIWEKRGYKSFEEHADALVHTINSYVKPDDTLIHLGDGFLNATDDLVINWWKRINCQNILYVLGNHEGVMFRLYKSAIKAHFAEKLLDGQEVYPYKILDKITIYDNYFEASIHGRHVVFSHFPFAIWNHSHHESFCLHSHNHGSFKESLPECPAPLRLDCGWDVLKRPYSWQEINAIMQKKKVLQLDHYGPETT